MITATNLEQLLRSSFGYIVDTDRVGDILIVDDEVHIAAVLAEVLTDEGFRVQVVSNGASALHVIERHPPALVLLDNMMPGMSGLEVLNHLRRSGYTDLPVIMVSAAGHPETFLQAGATAFFPKPFDFDQLIACVSEHVRMRPMHALEYGQAIHPSATQVIVPLRGGMPGSSQ